MWEPRDLHVGKRWPLAAVENAQSRKAFEKSRWRVAAGTQRSGVTCIFREALSLDPSETKVVVLKPLYSLKNY